jgi:hypothetical protein
VTGKNLYLEGTAVLTRGSSLARNGGVLKVSPSNLRVFGKYRARKFSLNRKRLYASSEPDFLLKIL